MVIFYLAEPAPLTLRFTFGYPPISPDLAYATGAKVLRSATFPAAAPNATVVDERPTRHRPVSVLIGEVVALACHVFLMVKVPPAVRSFWTSTKGASLPVKGCISYCIAIEIASSKACPGRPQQPGPSRCCCLPS